jgi:hypothetical protein
MRWIKLDHTCICLKKKLTHQCFKSSPSICTSWIDCVNFLHFLSSKICISPTVVVSSISPPRCHLSSGRRRHAPVPCHASFPSSQDELDISNSSFGNVSSCRLPSQAETEALNPYHHHRLPSSNRPTSTIHCYKKIISTLITLLTTQSCL